jgi:hypothetical protein
MERNFVAFIQLCDLIEIPGTLSDKSTLFHHFQLIYQSIGSTERLNIFHQLRLRDAEENITDPAYSLALHILSLPGG